jgi:hypothetical protein
MDILWIGATARDNGWQGEKYKEKLAEHNITSSLETVREHYISKNYSFYFKFEFHKQK